MRFSALLFSALACVPSLALSAQGPASYDRTLPPIGAMESIDHPATLDLDGLVEAMGVHEGSRLRALAPELSQAVASRAMKAVACASEQGQTVEKLVVVDMGLAARRKRLWAFDLSDQTQPRLIANARVAHGAGSDPDNDGLAQKFSNTPNSNMTSVGLYRIAERYYGSSGWSRRLDGLFERFNSKARDRAVVLHPAKYVSAQRVGRSQGCPAVNQATMDQLEKAGLSDAVLWIDAPNPDLAKAVDACAAKHERKVLAQRMATLRERLAEAPRAPELLLLAQDPVLADPAAVSCLAWKRAKVQACELTIPRMPVWPVWAGALAAVSPSKDRQ